MMLAMLRGAGSTVSASGARKTLVGINISDQNPQNNAKRSIAGIGAIAIRKMLTASVMMPSAPGAIITLIVISAALTRSPTCEYTS